MDGPLARARIAEQLDLSGASVTLITRDLLEAGLIHTAGKAPATGRRGRPQQMLAIAPGAATVLGAKVAEHHVTGVMVDLTGAVHDRFTVAHEAAGTDPIEALAAVLGDATASRRDTLVGVGLGVPGTVAAVPHGVVTSPMLGWTDVAMSERLGEHLGVPVVVGNDVNALVTGQRLYGLGRGVDNFITITLGRGIGLGIVMDGAVRRGRGGAGEVGHTRAVAGGPTCECGRTGCLEAVVAEPALLARAIDAGLVDAGTDADQLRELARSDDAVGQLFVEAGEALGDVTADLVNLLAPQQVVIAGEGTAAWPLYRPGFEPAFEAGLLGFHRGVSVVIDDWTDDTWARGAAALVLGSIFEPSGDATPSGAIAGRLHATDDERLTA